jgi:hypothetical protein
MILDRDQRHVVYNVLQVMLFIAILIRIVLET